MRLSPEDSKGEPVEKWGMVHEKEFGAGDMTKFSQRSSISHSSAVHAQNWVPHSHLVWSFMAAAGCCFGFLKDIFRLLDFGSQSDPELVPDYTVPLLDVYCRTIRAAIRCAEGLRIFP